MELYFTSHDQLTVKMEANRFALSLEGDLNSAPFLFVDSSFTCVYNLVDDLPEFMGCNCFFLTSTVRV